MDQRDRSVLTIRLGQKAVCGVVQEERRGKSRDKEDQGQREREKKYKCEMGEEEKGRRRDKGRIVRGSIVKIDHS